MEARFQCDAAQRPTGSSVPNFELVRFGRNHTGGINASGASAKAEVSDNDYAVGKLVDAISHSPIWAHTRDLRSGRRRAERPRPCGSHRSVAIVISPYVKQGVISSKLYNTDSTLRTMELLLNARPLTQYDAIANYDESGTTRPTTSRPTPRSCPRGARDGGAHLRFALRQRPTNRVQPPGETGSEDGLRPRGRQRSGPAERNGLESVKGMGSRMPAPKNAFGKAATAGVKASSHKTARTKPDLDD